MDAPIVEMPKAGAAAIVAAVKRLVGPDTLGSKCRRISPVPVRAHRHSTAHPTAGGVTPALKVD
jgi:hypothetical protein